MSKSFDLRAYLREQCPDLDSAKTWLRKWADGGQLLPGETEPTFTIRAMAGHVSDALEGKPEGEGYDSGKIDYMQTRFGAELARAAWRSE